MFLAQEYASMFFLIVQTRPISDTNAGVSAGCCVLCLMQIIQPGEFLQVFCSVQIILL
jgi:hypothetical protein